MVAYSFQKRFEAAIIADVKLFTIRAPRKRHARYGEQLQLYTGMRTKHCRLIGRRRARTPHNVVIDVRDQSIFVGETFPITRGGNGFDYEWAGQKVRLKEILDRDAFAVRDGFADWADMRTFWMAAHGTHGAEADATAFNGVIVPWFPSVIDADPVSPIERELEELGL